MTLVEKFFHNRPADVVAVVVIAVELIVTVPSFGLLWILAYQFGVDPSTKQLAYGFVVYALVVYELSWRTLTKPEKSRY